MPDTGKKKRKKKRVAEPWTFRLYRASPFSTSVTGILVAFTLLVFYVVVELISGRPAELLAGHPPEAVGCLYLLGDYRIGVVGILMLAYSMSARYKLAIWTRESAASLDQSDAPDAEGLAESRPWGFLPGLIGFAICFLFAIDIAERGVEWTSDYWIFPHLFSWAWTLPFGWIGGRLIYAIIADVLIISRITRSTTIKSLEDTRPVDTAVRHGLRTALVSLMFLGIVSVHFIDPGLNAGSTIFLVALYAIGSGISALPTLGIMQNYYDRRDEQLETLRAEIAVEEQQLLDKDPDYEPGRIGDLVSMEKRLTDYKVAVFRFSTLTRLAVYAFIGFLSWLGAAAVSVFVENLFDM